MVRIDNVYQKVLALANKEQRGYITPQEFNLLANKVQMEIFDSYFHDTKTAYHKKKNQMGSGFDDIEMNQEKLQPFQTIATWIQDAGNSWIDLTGIISELGINVDENLYMIDALKKVHIVPEGFSFATDDIANATTPGIEDLHFTEVTEMTNKEVVYSQHHPLLAASQIRPVFVRDSNSRLRIYPTPTLQTTFSLYYWRVPMAPQWGYVVANNSALFNVNTSINFELHVSEEERLVNRILQLAGVIIEDPSVQQAAMIDIQSTHQSQNN